MSTNSELRKIALANVCKLSDEAKRLADERITKRLLAEPRLATAKRVAFFASTATEPNLDEVVRVLKARGVRIYFPKVVGEDIEMILVDESTRWADNAWGIAEPTAWQSTMDLDVILVPMVAYNGLARMGHGKGYYDRFLAKAKGYKIGLAYKCQQMQFESKPHDVAMDKVITEEEICE